MANQIALFGQTGLPVGIYASHLTQTYQRLHRSDECPHHSAQTLCSLRRQGW